MMKDKPTKEQRLANSMDIEGLSRQDEPTAFVPREDYQEAIETVKELYNLVQYLDQDGYTETHYISAMEIAKRLIEKQ